MAKSLDLYSTHRFQNIGYSNTLLRVYNRRKVKQLNKSENCKALFLAKYNHLKYFFLPPAPRISKSSCSNAKALDESFFFLSF